MKTIFDSIFVNYAEYSYFKQLTKNERVHFFFEIYEAALIKNHGSVDLSGFFDTLKSTYSETTEDSIQDLEAIDYSDHDKVGIMIDDTNIMIESNSLRAAKHIIYKFIESGYILRRDVNLERDFRKDKITKYLRIFKIINQTSCLCNN
jgi:predicted DNA binding protein